MSKIDKRIQEVENRIDDTIWSISYEIEELQRNITLYQNLVSGDKEEYVDINDIIRRMKQENLYTREIENFFENYIKFYNN